MLLYFLACLALASALPAPFGAPRQFTSRVINGQDATSGQFPWQGSLQQNGRHFCGCSLISNKYALSAAHCKSNFVDAGFGGSNYQNLEQNIRVQTFYAHPQYNSLPFDYDYAVLTLSSDATYGDNIKAIKLPNQGDEIVGNAVGIISGWGYTQGFGNQVIPQTLQWTSINYVSEADCQNAWGSGIQITDRMQCVGGNGDVSSCMGDSGGPLTFDNNGETLLIGIASWAESNCRTTYPVGYAKVSAVRNWISSNTDV